MGGNISEEESVNPLRFSLDLPNMKLSFEGKESSLSEVRKIIEALGPELDEQEPFLDLRARLSDEFVDHPPLQRRLKNAMILDEEVRILKHTLAFQQEYDLDAGKSSRQVNAINVKGAVMQLFDQVQGTIKECFVHIRGKLDREQQAIIMDAIKQRLGMEVETRFFSTKKNLEGNVLVEAVCFGEGIAEAW
jgi:hypothetical protein